MSKPLNEKMCSTYDQISDRRCGYYENHGGKHNFARLDHDTGLERELRRQLDEVTRARDEACDIADTAIKLHGDFKGYNSARVAELRKAGR